LYCINGDLFGVEVTEAFLSESDARLRRIDGYFDILFDSKDYKHKDDVLKFPFELCTYGPGTSQEFQFEGLFQPIPKPAERIACLNRLIRSKAAKLSQYLRKASSVDLIIQDQGVIEGIQGGSLPRLFHDPELRLTILKSGFREIYYAVKVDSGAFFSVMARTTIFAEELMKFESAMCQIQTDFISYASMCAAYLEDHGFKNCYSRVDRDGLHIFTDVASCSYSKTGRKLSHITDGDRVISTGRVVEPNRDHEQFSKISRCASGSSFTIDLSRPLLPIPVTG